MILCRICGQPKQYMAHAIFHPVNRGRADTHAFRGRWYPRYWRTAVAVVVVVLTVAWVLS